MGGTHRASDGQQSLLFAPAGDDGLTRAWAHDRSTVSPEERPVGATLDRACPVGCRGTTECLCGQGELSDDPLWIENE